MKLIVLNDFPIVPPNHGGKIRIYNVYKRLSEKYDITYICFSNEERIRETKITATFKEVRVPKSGLQKKVEALLVQVLGVSVDDITAMFFCRYSSKMKSEVMRYLNNCDIIVLSHPYLYPLVKNNLLNKILFYEAHNVEYSLKRTILQGGLFRKFLLERVRNNEAEVANRSKAIFVTSSLERDAFRELYHINEEKIQVSPNGTDLSLFDTHYKNGMRVMERITARPIAIFIGSGHPPNVDAAKTIVRSIASSIRDVYFIICGSVCGGIKNEALGNNVGLTFEVSEEEKLELYRASDVALNPMISGSGTNLKMLDYMAAGLPIVTTPIGARGLDLNETNAIICDISEFPERIRQVLSDKNLYDTLSRSGRKLVEEKYDWKRIVSDMAEAFEISVNC